MQSLRISLVTIVLLFFFGQIMAVNQYNWKEELKTYKEAQGLNDILPLVNLEEFLKMSARDIERYTGKRMGIKDRLSLWSAKRFIRKNIKDKSILSSAYNSSMPQIAYIILAVVGLGWLAIGILDGFTDRFWIISLVLYLLGYFPGLIYTLIIMGNYY